jgi:hypothetical protein
MSTGTERDARELEVLKTLPRPPAKMHLCTTDEVIDWLRRCAEVSAEGCRVAFSAHRWPGSLQQRLAVWGRYTELEREAQVREAAQQEKARQEQRDKAKAAEQRQLKKLGWARGDHV